MYQCVVDGTTPSRTIFVGAELPPPPSLKIKRITDVPEDQGGWVHIHFEADPKDAAGEITQYGIWQWKVDKWIPSVPTGLLGFRSQPSPSVQVEISSLGELNAGGMHLFNTPNPFSDNTIITFTLNESSVIELSVTDLTGKLIGVPANREYAPGVHQVGFNAAGLNAGVYLCRLRSISGVLP